MNRKSKYLLVTALHIYSVFAEKNTEIRTRSNSVDVIAESGKTQSRSMKHNIEHLTDKNALYLRLISEDLDVSKKAQDEILSQAVLSKAVYNGFGIVMEKKSKSDKLKRIQDIKKNFEAYIAEIDRVGGSKNSMFNVWGSTEEKTKKSIIDRIRTNYGSKDDNGEYKGCIDKLMLSFSDQLSSPLDGFKTDEKQKENRSEINRIIKESNVPDLVDNIVKCSSLGLSDLRNTLEAVKNGIDPLYQNVKKESIKQYLNHFYGSLKSELRTHKKQEAGKDEKKTFIGNIASAIFGQSTPVDTVFGRYKDNFEVLDYCCRTPEDSEKESAVLLRNKDTGDLQVVFMGTKSNSDWLHNGNILKASHDQLDTHSGFLAVSDNAIAAFNTKIAEYMKANQDAKLFVTGHSLGGAAAQVFASTYLDPTQVKAQFEKSEGRVVLVTFAQPASKHRDVVKKDDQRFAGNYIRVFNPSDMVVHSLMNPGRALKQVTGYEYNSFYDHGGLSLRLTERNYWDTTRKTFDKLYAHSMEHILSDLAFSFGQSQDKPGKGYDPISNARNTYKLTEMDVLNIKKLDNIQKKAFIFDDNHNFTLNDSPDGEKIDKKVLEEELQYFFKKMLDEKEPQYSTKGIALTQEERSLRLINFANTILNQKQYNLHGLKPGDWAHITYRYLVESKNNRIITEKQYKKYRDDLVRALGVKEVLSAPVIDETVYKDNKGEIMYEKYFKDVLDSIDSSISVASLYNQVLERSASKYDPINEGDAQDNRRILKQISGKLYTLLKQKEDINQLMQTVQKNGRSLKGKYSEKKSEAIEQMKSKISELDKITEKFKKNISKIYNDAIQNKLWYKKTIKDETERDAKWNGIDLACDLHALNLAFGSSINIDLSKHYRTHTNMYKAFQKPSEGGIKELMNFYDVKAGAYSPVLIESLKDFLNDVPSGGECFKKIQEDIKKELLLLSNEQYDDMEDSDVQQDVTDTKEVAPAVSAEQKESSSEKSDLTKSVPALAQSDVNVSAEQNTAPAVNAEQQESSSEKSDLTKSVQSLAQSAGNVSDAEGKMASSAA